MSEKRADMPWHDGALFNENVNKIPPELTLRYAGKHIAYSWDGTQILACGDDYADLDRNLLAAGIDPSRVVHAYIPSDEEDCLIL